MDILGKIKELFLKYEDEFDVATIVTVIGTSVYLSFYTMNWIFVSFFKITGLWYVLIAWVWFAFIYCTHMWWAHRKASKDEDDESELLP